MNFYNRKRSASNLGCHTDAQALNVSRNAASAACSTDYFNTRECPASFRQPIGND